MEHSDVIIRDSEEAILFSPEIGQRYHLFIQKPNGYDSSDATYSVLYLLDGDQFFGMTTDIVRLLNHRDGVPEMLVVGIGYGGDVSGHFNERIRDLSPSEVAEFPTSGGGERFLSFIKEKVIPYVEEKYRTTPGSRTLVGVSIGGLFGLYTFFEHPEWFSRYLISSPSVSWDEGMIFQDEQKSLERRSEFSGRIFLSVGGLEKPKEMIEPVLGLGERLKNRKEEGLTVWCEEIDGEGHFSVQPAAISRGLRRLFSPEESRTDSG